MQTFGFLLTCRKKYCVILYENYTVMSTIKRYNSNYYCKLEMVRILNIYHDKYIKKKLHSSIK